MKHCRHFYAIETELIQVPAKYQRPTRLPGHPQGNDRLGFSERRRELLTVAMQDRKLGGTPRIRKVPLPALND